MDEKRKVIPTGTTIHQERPTDFCLVVGGLSESFQISENGHENQSKIDGYLPVGNAGWKSWIDCISVFADDGRLAPVQRPDYLPSGLLVCMFADGIPREDDSNT